MFAIGFAIFRHWRGFTAKAFLSRQTGKDFLDGATIFPLLLLAGSALSSDLTKALLEANKIILPIAAVMALLALLENDKVER